MLLAGKETTPAPEVAAWFDVRRQQLPDDGRGDSQVRQAPDYPLGEFMEALGKDLESAVHDNDPDPAVYKEAGRQLGLLRESLSRTPAVMERARTLIRHAASMVRSPMCTGPE